MKDLNYLHERRELGTCSTRVFTACSGSGRVVGLWETLVQLSSGVFFHRDVRNCTHKSCSDGFHLGTWRHELLPLQTGLDVVFGSADHHYWKVSQQNDRLSYAQLRPVALSRHLCCQTSVFTSVSVPPTCSVWLASQVFGRPGTSHLLPWGSLRVAVAICCLVEMRDIVKVHSEFSFKASWGIFD